MPYVSLAARQKFNAPATDDTPIVLIRIDHDDWDEPVHLASDYTQRLSTDPYRLGVLSDGVAHWFLAMGAILPDDKHGSPPTAHLVFATLVDVADAAGVDLAGGLVGIARQIREAVTVDMSVVLASDPDSVEMRWTGFLGTKASYDGERLTLDLSREPIVNEPFPSLRQTKQLFPGLFK